MMSQLPLFTIVCVTVITAARKVSQFVENDDSENNNNNKQSELNASLLALIILHSLKRSRDQFCLLVLCFMNV